MKNTPLMEILEKYKNKENISFAMPGHKNGKGIPEPLKSNFFSYDVTELADTENLLNPGKIMKQSCKETASFFGAEESFFLVNGSTSGIFTMLMSCCLPGDKILINRTCHTSVINACLVLGLKPLYLNQAIVEKLNIPDGIDCDEVERILSKNTVSAVLITSPNYYGIVSDVEKLAKITYRHKIPLLVDEAHGTHFSASPDIFPKSAMMAGADMCVQSTHKTLNAGNQTAFLHLNSGIIDYEKVRNCYKIFQTTSPSYPLIASADFAIKDLAENGRANWNRVHKKCAEIRTSLKNLILSPDREWRGIGNIFDIDECRLVLNISQYKMTGFELAEKLRLNYKIDVEMADLSQIVLIPTPSNSDEDFEILENALLEILKKSSRKRPKTRFAVPPQSHSVMTPSDAFYHKGRLLNFDDAHGAVSKVSVTPYPPGIPTILPGERITKKQILYIRYLEKSGAVITGINDGKIEIAEE